MLFIDCVIHYGTATSRVDRHSIFQYCGRGFEMSQSESYKSFEGRRDISQFKEKQDWSLVWVNRLWRADCPSDVGCIYQGHPAILLKYLNSAQLWNAVSY